MKKKSSPSQLTRHAVQSLALLFSFLWLLGVIFSVKGSIHALCPYSLVCFGFSKASIFTLAAGVFGITVLISMLILVYTIFRGRGFCAYLCPLGTVQEAIFSLRSAQYRKKQQLSYIYEHKFNRVKYVILIITLLLAITGMGYIYIRLCPIYALSLFPLIAFPGLAILLLLIIIPGFFLERFWCRFLCPYAALMNIFQGVGQLFGIRRKKIMRNLERCVDCGICNAFCPMNIDIAAEEYIHSPECIHCYLCACKCPKPGTICCKRED